jgi:peptidoglycan-N-acetylglucosamine deacetylase
MNILTFDIEEWFHLLGGNSPTEELSWQKYESRIHQNMERIFDLLDSHQQSATFFCLGWIAQKYPEIIKEIDRRGYEIGTHSHLHQLVYTQDYQQFKIDIEKSIKSLEDITGKKVRTYRAPGFSVRPENAWVFEILAQNGIEIDCSVFPDKRAYGDAVVPTQKVFAGFDNYGEALPSWIDVNGIRMKEFPINMAHIFGKKWIFSGGGYFRFFPYDLIKYFGKKSDYMMTYFHPRDFDPDQPVLPEISWVHRFRAYYGLSSSYAKLDRLMDDFSFMDLAQADAAVDWASVPVKKLV